MENKSATIWHNVDHKSARIHGPWVRHEEHLRLITQARAEGREAGLREAAGAVANLEGYIKAQFGSSFVYVNDMDYDAILALIDTPPTEGGE